MTGAGTPPPGFLSTLARSVFGHAQFLHFRLFRRHRYDQLTLEEVLGRPLLVLPEVFNPKLLRTGEALARAIDRLGPSWPRGARVLDMGTGSGVGGVFAAGHADRVVSVDVNPHAVRCARINALLNGLEGRMEVREGDLFEAVPAERFDVILFNPPYLPGEARRPLERAFYGLEVCDRFAASLRDHLAPGGQSLVLLSSHAPVPKLIERFESEGLRCELVIREDLVSEDVLVYRLTADGVAGGSRS